MKKIYPALTAIALLTSIAAGCSFGSGESAGTATAATYTGSTASPLAEAVLPASTQGAATAGASIILGDSVTIKGEGAEADGQQVKITSPGTYRLSGILEDGSVEVNTPGGSVELVLEGVSITNSAGAAIHISAASWSIITLQDLTVNALDGTGGDSEDAALSSQAPLTIKGGGYLNIDGQYRAGIAAAQQLEIADGIIHLASKGIGLEAVAIQDQGNSSIKVSGGYLYLESDGTSMEASGPVSISGGTVIALSGLEASSAEGSDGGALTITGGTVIAAGTTLPAVAAGSAQRSVLIGYGSLQAAGTLAVIQSGGEKLLAFAPAQAYRQLLYSAGSLDGSADLEVRSGGSATGEAVDGLYSSTAYTSGTLIASAATISSGGGSSAADGQITANNQQSGTAQNNGTKEDS